MAMNVMPVQKSLLQIRPKILCIHGNHEMRPESITSYSSKVWRGGKVWYEPEHPSLLFAADGEVFDLEGIKHLIIGGAYSVDKQYRLERGYGWWLTSSLRKNQSEGGTDPGPGRLES